MISGYCNSTKQSLRSLNTSPKYNSLRMNSSRIEGGEIDSCDNIAMIDIICNLSDIGVVELSFKILSFLDDCSLARAQMTCSKWRDIIADGLLWRRQVNIKLRNRSTWREIATRSRWSSRCVNQHC